MGGHSRDQDHHRRNSFSTGDIDVPDSLEGWVAVKEHPFKDISEKTRIEFHVAWNEVEGKVAITCREKSRVASDITSSGQCDVFTFNEIKGIHEQLCLVHPTLGPYLPQLPIEPQGMWAYFYNQEPPSDDICTQLEHYLKIALEICGHSLLLTTLFEEHTYEEYFERISELKRRVYDEAVTASEDQLQNVLFLRDGSINMLDMVENYKLEDDSLYKLNIALAELYNYLLQPFLDMRELACSKLREAKQGLENPNFGKRRKADFTLMFSEWQEHYEHALDSIQELYIEYYNKTVDILTSKKKRMLDDKKKFGRNAFELGAEERYYSSIEDLHLEKIQLLQHTKKQYENQRDKIKQQIVILEETPQGIKSQAEHLEQHVYDWQVKVLDSQLEVNEEEGRLIKHRIGIITKELSAKDDAMEFYDAVEDPDDISSEDEEPKSMITGNFHRKYGKASSNTGPDDPRLILLRSKMAAITKRRAQIRNKLGKLTRDKKEKEKSKVKAHETYKRHHSVQLKKDEQKEEMAKKKEFYEQERKKTLERLRKSKMKKFPSPSTIRPRQKFSRPGSTGSNSSRNSSDIPDGNSGTDQLLSIIEESISPDGENIPPPPPPPPGPPPPLSLVLGGGAPPAPPPPPPPPNLLSSPLKVPHAAKNSSSQLTEPMDKGATLSFDMSTIAGAREKLNKTSDYELTKSKTVNMDPMTDMLELIKKGVLLKKVNRAEAHEQSGPPSNEHVKQLEEVMNRMKAKLNPPDEEDNGEQEGNEEEDFDD